MAETNAKDMVTFKQTNENALQEILQHLERVVREYVSKDELDKLMRTSGASFKNSLNGSLKNP